MNGIGTLLGGALLLALAAPTLHGRAAPPQAGPQTAQAIAETTAAFAASYNLNHDEALARARKAVQLDPGNSRVQRGLASIIWLQILFFRGAMTVDHYLGNLSRGEISLPKPEPALAKEFKDALGSAIQIAEARLRRNPNDLDALYDAGAAYGVQASYQASVEGSIIGGIRSAQTAVDRLNTVLQRDPSRAAAGVIVGTYRYIVATQNWFVRLFAGLMGLPGDKDLAIAILEAAAHDPLSRVDAKTALILIYTREGRHSEAMRLAHELTIELPQNRLFKLEEGAAAIRAGKGNEAEEALTRGLEQFAKDPRRKIPGEHALWLYKRGLGRLNMNRLADSKADLDLALTLKPETWVEGRIHVTLGKLADLGGNRQGALNAYWTGKKLCETAKDTVCVEEARHHYTSPFTFDRRNR